MSWMEGIQNKLKRLEELKPKLDQHRQEFAQSLITQGRGRGLSDKQIDWVGKLIAMAEEPNPELPKLDEKLQAGLKGIVDLFDKAAEHLKFPSFKIRVNGDVLRLSRAGQTARAPGTVNLTTDGPFESRTWFGRITREGQWEPSRRADAAHNAKAIAALTAFAADPVKVAADYGHETSECCFCGIELTDPRSVKVGYGPICAGHWGLPWGN